jgi:hypothetical protein
MKTLRKTFQKTAGLMRLERVKEEAKSFGCQAMMFIVMMLLMKIIYWANAIDKLCHVL